MDAVVGPEDQVVEIESAVDVPLGKRLAAAERFAAKRRAFSLGRRSRKSLTAFAYGRDVAADADRLLAEIETALSETSD